MAFKYFSRNGEIRPIEEANISLSNIEYQYGFGVYETIRVANGTPRFLADHLVRLMESTRIIGIEHPFDERFIGKSISELIEKNEVDTCNLKILLIGGKEPMLTILCLNPLFPDKKLYRDGADFITYEYERPFPHAKCLNMLQSYLAYKKARENNCYDALLVNSEGCITEGTRTNFFCLKGRTIMSPPEEQILLGVTRAKILEVAQENGFSLQLGEILFGEIEDSDCAFVTSTSSKIVPVRSIDGIQLKKISEDLRALMSAFDEFLSAPSSASA